MDGFSDNESGGGAPFDSSKYDLFETLKLPVCVIDTDGIIIYSNKSFKEFSGFGKNVIKLDLEQPLFPEYKKRVARAYLKAMKGAEEKCFAVINMPGSVQLPIEIYLFPLFNNGSVSSILTIIKIVDKRLLSFDRSSLSMISEDDFKYDNLHYEFSPIPIIRVNRQMEIIKFSNSFEGFIEIISDEKNINELVACEKLFPYSFDLIKKYVTYLIKGEITFKRVGEIKISASNKQVKIANLILYPIVQSNEISEVEILFEDITKISRMRDEINSLNRDRLLKNITKGFLHTLNNSINVIVSKTQLLQQITEKEAVLEGINLIENSANEIIKQTRRIENYVREKENISQDNIEPLFDIIEDAIEFSKMQFKVDDKEKRRRIKIEKKYYTDVNVKSDTKLLREIFISIILKVSAFIQKNGILEIILKNSNDLCINIKAEKDYIANGTEHTHDTVDLFPGIDIRQISEKLNLKIIEEESQEFYSIKTIFPRRLIIDKQKEDPGNTEYRLRDMDIMIVEDEMPLQKILYELFDQMGNRVFICDSGDKALSEFITKKYDILITDYDIAGITGIELAVRVKEIDENIITVLLSGWVINELGAYKNVIDLFLPKPFMLDNLIKEISKTAAGRS